MQRADLNWPLPIRSSSSVLRAPSGYLSSSVCFYEPWQKALTNCICGLSVTSISRVNRPIRQVRQRRPVKDRWVNLSQVKCRFFLFLWRAKQAIFPQEVRSSPSLNVQPKQDFKSKQERQEIDHFSEVAT